MCLAMIRTNSWPRAVRVVEQPQLQGPPGLAHRAHALDVAGDGRAAAIRGAVADVREIL